MSNGMWESGLETWGRELKRCYFVKSGLGILFLDMIGGESERGIILSNGVWDCGLETWGRE